MKRAMIYMVGKSERTIEECIIFGDSITAILQSEEYKDFKSDGYTEEGVFHIELLSGSGILPTYLARG